jgi:hypothetical protein
MPGTAPPARSANVEKHSLKFEIWSLEFVWDLSFGFFLVLPATVTFRKNSRAHVLAM